LLLLSIIALRKRFKSVEIEELNFSAKMNPLKISLASTWMQGSSF
jgi:hypothetical protein